ncbi:MAG: hypothetical protein LBL65_02065 [Campylobacteraceae bacterium]|jgi:tRNA modification GTPase|nr:hypothetical protein [Campylobacteraceae bacterium]
MVKKIIPNSYTTKDMIEFQCHGGTIVANMILETVLKSGTILANS